MACEKNVGTFHGTSALPKPPRSRCRQDARSGQLFLGLRPALALQTLQLAPFGFRQLGGAAVDEEETMLAGPEIPGDAALAVLEQPQTAVLATAAGCQPAERSIRRHLAEFETERAAGHARCVTERARRDILTHRVSLLMICGDWL